MLKRKLANGAFGSVYIALDCTTNQKVAVKLEKTTTASPQLAKERVWLSRMAMSPGFPDSVDYVEQGQYRCLIMNLLGPSLQDLFNLCGNKFTLKTVRIYSCV